MFPPACLDLYCFQDFPSILRPEGVGSPVAGSIYCFGGTEETPGVPFVCQMLDFLCFFCPPLVFEFPYSALNNRHSGGVSFPFGLASNVLQPCTKGLPLFKNKVFDFIKPVLVPLRFRTQHCLPSGEDGGFQQVPMYFNVIRLLWW